MTSNAAQKAADEQCDSGKKDTIYKIIETRHLLQSVGETVVTLMQKCRSIKVSELGVIPLIANV